MAATINGKSVLANGTHIFRTGERVSVPGLLPFEVLADEAMPYGIATTVSPTTGVFVFSVDGMTGNADVASTGTLVWQGRNVVFNVYAMRIAALAGNNQQLYRFDYSFVDA